MGFHRLAPLTDSNYTFPFSFLCKNIALKKRETHQSYFSKCHALYASMCITLQLYKIWILYSPVSSTHRKYIRHVPFFSRPSGSLLNNPLCTSLNLQPTVHHNPLFQLQVSVCIKNTALVYTVALYISYF